ncbi:glutaredoxin domain-containing protein [Streptomyces roseicoloratus]|uniref:Glutaredoxin domain-containing protein n=1 Tax=Streptomyces roseicoloratus TaxID=2508722 RepID=A0ABY9S246_9ACTN|nr:glutaredoxin domain-containing protein [Streptomyces roseicoloratus]WMX48506.1 glutaredoxin domain-containing protein [Streptomyces roseicoloratus]
MTRAWLMPILMGLCGALLAAGMFAKGSTGSGVVLLAGFLVLAGANSPLMFPRSVGAAGAKRRAAEDGRPVVYWRAGCPYCMSLRVRLGRDARRVHWVDIWRDPEGAADVRAANDGNETVPTVVVAGRPHTNPDVEWVRAQLPPRSASSRSRKR